MEVQWRTVGISRQKQRLRHDMCFGHTDNTQGSHGCGRTPMLFGFHTKRVNVERGKRLMLVSW